MYRAQILFDPQQHRALREIARREGRSLSSLVREMINDQLNRRKEEQDDQIRHYMAVIDTIRDHRKEVLDKRVRHELAVDIAKVIQENRNERNGRIVEAGRPAGD
jgi:hypothetical protein